MTGINNQNGSKGNIGEIHHRTLDWNEDKAALYRDWASKYDEDVSREEYAAPQATAKELVDSSDFSLGEVKVLDAGCGTGLVGVHLQEMAGSEGFRISLEGCDISPDMALLAKERGYADCSILDMNRPLHYPSDSFDGATCAGTFIQGHVKAHPALPELCRVVKPGGCVVATIRTSYLDQSFEDVLEDLEKQGHSIKRREFQYLRGVAATMLTIVSPAARD